MQASASSHSWMNTHIPTPQENPVGYANLEAFIECCFTQHNALQQRLQRAGIMLLCCCLSRLVLKQQQSEKRSAFLHWRLRALTSQSSSSPFCPAITHTESQSGEAVPSRVRANSVSTRRRSNGNSCKVARKTCGSKVKNDVSVSLSMPSFGLDSSPPSNFIER